MELTVNGKPFELPAGASVAVLIERMALGEKRVAVEVNRDLVVKKEWAATILQPGDQVEVVTFVGGG